MTPASTLASALDRIPDLLLDAGNRESRDAALVALDALGEMDTDPSVLVVIGGGGSGKSSVVNALVGSDIASVSPLRPTTLGVTVFGRSNHSAMDGTADYIYTDGLRDGAAVVDTPSWDLGGEAVRIATIVAHTVVVVLTPARYGDSVATNVVRGLPDTANVLIVANRMPADPEEHDDVLDGIESTFDRTVHMHYMEGETIELPASLMAELPVDVNFPDEKRSYERAGAELGRSIARAVSGAAADLGDVQRAIGVTAAMPGIRQMTCSIDDWPATRSALIEVAESNVSAYDDAVVERSGNDLAARIRADLPAPDEDILWSSLEGWHADAAETFRRSAVPRWRREATLELCARWSWVLSMDQTARPPRRVRRAMRGSLEAAIDDAAETLRSVVNSGLRDRQAQWHEVVAEAGSYKPGELFAAADSLDGGEASDG